MGSDEPQIDVESIDTHVIEFDPATLEETKRLDDTIDEIVEQLDSKGYLAREKKHRPIKILLKRRFDKDVRDRLAAWLKGIYVFGWKEGYREALDRTYNQKLDDSEFAREAMERYYKRINALTYRKPRNDPAFNAWTTQIVKDMRAAGHLKEDAEPKELAGVHSTISRRYVKFLKSLNTGKIHRAYQLGWVGGIKQGFEER